MKKILTLVIGLFLLIELVSAVTNNDVSYFFKKGESFDIKRECFYNGAPCDHSVFNCNVTIYYTNNSIFVNNQIMTGQDTFYNYTIYDTTQPIGFYRCSMHCTDGVNSGSEIFYFKINQSGDNRNLSLFLILSFSSIILLFLAVVWQQEYIGFIAGALFIVTGIYVMIYGFADLADDYTRAIAYVCIGIGLICEVSAGYKIAEETGFANGEYAGGIDYD
jgi:hypothetical protein